MRERKRRFLIGFMLINLVFLSACSNTSTQNLEQDIQNGSDVHLRTGSRIKLSGGVNSNTDSIYVTYVGESTLELSKRMTSERSELFRYNIQEGTIFTFPISNEKAKVIKIESDKNEVTVSFNIN